MDDLNLIAQVLCHFDLPDAEVYAAMAALRDALKAGQGVESARRDLDLRFRTSVALGFNLGQRANPWVCLAERAKDFELREQLEVRALHSGRPDSLYRRDPLTAKVELVRGLLDRLKLNDLEVRAALASLPNPGNRQRALRQVLAAFDHAVLESLGHGQELNTWTILSRRPELQDEPELLGFVQLLARHESHTPRMGWSIKRHIWGLLSDEDFPEHLDGGGGGSPVPRNPSPGPNPTLKNRQQPPRD